VFVERRRVGRRSGAIMLVDSVGKLSGIFTDSDLARLLENRRDGEIDGPISKLMTRNPKTAAAGTLLADAVKVMGTKKISELPVIDSAGVPLGMLDVTDIVTLLPDEHAREWLNASATNEAPPTAGKVHETATDGTHIEDCGPTTLPFANQKSGENRI
jgi:arabinose-5-phosphate isomerase